ncbi:WD repeat-containing protein 44-like isoform X2 [Phoenix dactylifera]|uniref:WD repeat-containing protein 44-like isoform X2 n=1 Tax=Phoenix dactylifera TaxID=42345 RepID=A0A8B8ZBS5_PHODC|nr:WD repeat-containing protein 44-like isoform X2 [Phoenix dactylifera]
MRAERYFVGGGGEEEEKEEFFDLRDDVSTVYDSCPGSPGRRDSCSDENFISVSDSLYRAWIGDLISVQGRRKKFLRWMGLELRSPHEDCVSLGGDVVNDDMTLPIDRATSDGQAVLPRSSDSNNWTSMCSSSNDNTMLMVDDSGRDNNATSICDAGSDRITSVDEFERSPGISSFVRQVMQRDGNRSNNSKKTARRRRIGWLWRLGAVACIVDRHWEENSLSLSTSHQSGSASIRRVRVRAYKKRSKLFSALYAGQNIKAHDGAILTMKFSPDGQYLASGGEDAVVYVWCVMESERTAENDIPKNDHSCIYFSVNHNSELVPLHANDEEKKGKLWSMRTSDSACVVVPPDVFQISEKPIHIFRGHEGDVLDISWSKSKYLLSSSVDKTVRLWLVGCDDCLKVFSHNDYVTCVHFNPINEIYFMSGSIDGKVRIWEISGCQVVDWTDIRDIVTAVCYHPDGKNGVVGSMSGDCRFYDATDNQLHLEARISLLGKKKSPYKRITGFQVQILHGVDIVCKYKGLRNSGSQISASFTSDGRHIISASEDSYVYVWSYSSQDAPRSNQGSRTRSCERFFSSNVSVAIPWQGMESRGPVSDLSQFLPLQQVPDNQSQPGLRGDNSLSMSSGSFSREFSESLPKGSATWPEENLPSSLMTPPALPKSQYKFLKTSCQNNSHAWGQVIVTAGWDGQIRLFQNYGLPTHV